MEGGGTVVASEPGCHLPGISKQLLRKPPFQAHVLSSPGAGCGAGWGPLRAACRAGCSHPAPLETAWDRPVSPSTAGLGQTVV